MLKYFQKIDFHTYINLLCIIPLNSSQTESYVRLKYYLKKKYFFMKKIFDLITPKGSGVMAQILKTYSILEKNNNRNWMSYDKLWFLEVLLNYDSAFLSLYLVGVMERKMDGNWKDERMVSIHHLVLKILERINKKDLLSIYHDPQICILPIQKNVEGWMRLMSNKLL